MEQPPQGMDEPQQRPQNRTRQPAQDRERREVPQQDVLHHVDAERALDVVVDRRRERHEQQHDAEREEANAPARRGCPAPTQGLNAPGVESREQQHRHDPERLERPVRHAAESSVGRPQ